MSRLESLVWLWLAVLFTLIVVMSKSHGAVIECNVSPAHDGNYWLWRQIDGRKCWFPAPRGQRSQDQPKSSLRWPRSKPASPPSARPAPDEIPFEDKPPWELLPRFRGVTGWDHQE
jgi:hypothetical protein